MFFTHLAPYRLLEGLSPPVLKTTIKPRPGYFGYVPETEGLPSIQVGREWFLDAVRRAGFDAAHVVVRDGVTETQLDWFVGVKPLTVSTPRRRPPRSHG